MLQTLGRARTSSYDAGGRISSYDETWALSAGAASLLSSLFFAGYMCGVAKPPKQWYCSQLVGAALNHAGVADLSDQQLAHPESLYVALMPLTYLDTVRQLSNVEF
mgnify:CR=1 FL=1